LVHTIAPETLNVPARHILLAGLGVVEPATQAYPALQFVHDGEPATLNVPGGHMAVAGVDDTEPAGHA
jgi:hypothetical protein